ncbi:MAG: T9SS type A sorting domain-containing protein [Bacteroidetes bacterium]|nr:T9SS type A sorting domain-containing protein [Bacteroidota bacterium]
MGGGGVFLSTNNGGNWTAVNNGLTNSVVRSFAIYGSNVFAGSAGDGVFLSTNNGSNWTAINDGLNYLSVYSLAISGNNIYAGTNGNGVYKRQLSDIITDVEEIHNIIPDIFSLSQNYPNPFNPSTVISFQLSSVSKVSLKVYDLLGREVAVLVNEEKPAGIYKVNFNAGNLPSGVYFYKMKAGSFVQTKKLILMK